MATKIITKNPLILLLQNEDGATPGRYESAESFAKTINKLKNEYPKEKFQFIPFSYYGGIEEKRGPALKALLAIAE